MRQKTGLQVQMTFKTSLKPQALYKNLLHLCGLQISHKNHQKKINPVSWEIVLSFHPSRKMLFEHSTGRSSSPSSGAAATKACQGGRRSQAFCDTSSTKNKIETSMFGQKIQCVQNPSPPFIRVVGIPFLQTAQSYALSIRMISPYIISVVR